MQRVPRRLDPAALADEIASQVREFVDAFGRAPDFIDGHQHVHLFPQVRDALLEVAKEAAPDAWVRQCGSALPIFQRLGDRKGLLLDLLSRSFRRRAAALGVSAPIRPLPAPTTSAATPISRPCFRASSTGCRTAAWSCAIPALWTTSCSGSIR